MSLISQNNRIYWVIYQNDCLLLLKENNQFLSSIESILVDFENSYKINEINSCEYYCTELAQDIALPSTIHALPLKTALALLSDTDYGIAVKAYSVIQWEKNHQFCGCCGSRTLSQMNRFERSCSACKLSFFPRISPSIIVLIKKGDRLLMARGPHHPSGVYGLIAGFVEVGETLEAAVHREVMEEVGLKIKNLVYAGSQPWPFPHSLMMAFTADYESGDITINKDEIEQAGWYRYDQLPGLPSTKISIASKLIDDFISDFL